MSSMGIAASGAKAAQEDPSKLLRQSSKVHSPGVVCRLEVF